jgi:RHS repeat-associated protein
VRRLEREDATFKSVLVAFPVSYQYDNASRLTQVAQGSNAVDLGYDNAGRRTSLTYPNGTSTAYSYDDSSRLTELLHQGPSGVIEDLLYTYDAAGNRISFDRTNPQAQLPDAVQAAYNAANQMTQFNTDTLTYDANGNLTFDGTNTYTWDARNRLVQMSNGSLLASFVYDALGRRVSKTMNGATTRYLYDGNDIVAEIQSGAISATYLRSLNIDEPFLRASSVAEYYHTDALGSTLALTDQNGAVQTTYQYEAFGQTTITGSSTNPFQYTGRENDGNGLYYFRARYYREELFRFVTPDPSGSPMRPAMFIGGIPWVTGGACSSLVISDPYRLQYLYVKDNPLNLMDSSGLAGTEACDYYDKECNKKYPSKGRKDRNDSSAAAESYECKAGQCCRDFGESPKVNCIRGCLIKIDHFCSQIGDSVSRQTCRRIAHYTCYPSCGQYSRFANEPPSCKGLL